MFFKFADVTKIVADGGLGNDTIDLSLVTGAVIAEIHGGEGNDTIDGTDGDARSDQLFGDGGNDTISGRGGPDVIRGGVGNDTLGGDGGADELFGEEGNDTLDGGTEVDALDGGPGDNTFTRSDGADDYNLFNFGSTITIDGTLGNPILDFSGKPQALTFFVRLDQIEVGFDLIPGQDGLQIGDFNSKVIVTSPSGVTDIIGSDAADVFYIASTAGPLTLNGNKGDDRYVFEAGAGTITATVADTGNPWDSDNLIEVLGAAIGRGVRHHRVPDHLRRQHVINYIPGTADGSVTQILLDARGGDDTIRVRSTSEYVPVRAAGGAGDDRIVVGGDGANGLDNIRAYARTGLNKSRSPDLSTVFGLGPVVLVGGAGHDEIVLDDSLDADAEIGNITAFTEARDGGLTVEVGVVSGLGMKLTDPDPGGRAAHGRAEFEGFEVVQVQLGTGADTFTVGGDSIFPELPVNRRQETVADVTTSIIDLRPHHRRHDPGLRRGRGGHAQRLPDRLAGRRPGGGRPGHGGQLAGGPERHHAGEQGDEYVGGRPPVDQRGPRVLRAGVRRPDRDRRGPRGRPDPTAAVHRHRGRDRGRPGGAADRRRRQPS